jgi:hypothetical protein
MSLETKLLALVQAIGPDIKALRTADGNLSSLSTTAKSNLVAAINEVYGIAQAAAGGGVSINDTAGDGNTTVTWSANKIFDEINASISGLRTELRDGAGAALDTFKEIADAMAADDTAAAAMSTAIANRVRFDEAQVLTAPQQTTARSNIGAASATDLGTTNTNLSTLSTNVGNTEQDLVAAYNTAKA